MTSRKKKDIIRGKKKRKRTNQ